MKNTIQTARISVFLMVVMTVLNCAFMLFELDTYLPFSATFPYMTFLFGVILGLVQGLLPLALCLFMLGACVLAAYILLAILGKKRRVCFLIAAIFMLIDTVLLLFLSLGDHPLLPNGLYELLFHAWIIFDLMRAYFAKPPVKKLPEVQDPTEDI